MRQRGDRRNGKAGWIVYLARPVRLLPNGKGPLVLGTQDGRLLEEYERRAQAVGGRG